MKNLKLDTELANAFGAYFYMSENGFVSDKNSYDEVIVEREADGSINRINNHLNVVDAGTTDERSNGFARIPERNGTKFDRADKNVYAETDENADMKSDEPENTETEINGIEKAKMEINGIENAEISVTGTENEGYIHDMDESENRTNHVDSQRQQTDSVNSREVANGQNDGNPCDVPIKEAVIITRCENIGTMPKKDRKYKIKLVKTAFLLWNMTNLGWDYGQIGPIFPDLQDIAGVSLSQGSSLFTAFAVGYFLGCSASGFIQTKVNLHFMLFVYTMISAASMTLLPWIPTFEVMALLRAINGFGIGGQDTSVHALLFEIWGHKVGPYFQMLHVVYAVGGIISPLITKPFLREGLDTQVQAINSTKIFFQQNSTPYFDPPPNITNIAQDDGITAESKVHFALLISGIMNISAAVPFLVIYFRYGETILRQKVSVKGDDDKEQSVLPRPIELVVLCIFMLNAFVATAFLDLYPSFLTTFVIEEVGMTQQIGSNLTSAYFAMYAFGNFLMIFGSLYIKITKIIVFSYTGTIILLIGIIISTIFPNEALLSVLIPLSGLSMSVIIPTIYTWINEHVTPVTGKIASGLLASGSLGIALNPLLAGYLMETFTPMWLIYLSLSKTLICSMLFITALIFTNKCSSVTETGTGFKEENTNEIADGRIDIYMNGKLQNIHECTQL